MLTFMRKWAVWIMLVALIGFLLTIFLDWGMGLDNMPGRKGNTVGKIGNEHVGIQEFSQLVERERQMRQQQGQQTDDGSLPMQVWDAYVSEIITQKAIESLGIQATTEEVFAYLRDNPPPAFTQSEYFQTNGRFDQDKYLAFINTPSSYDNPSVVQVEQYIRTFMVPINKLNMLIEGGDAPSLAEIEYEYRAQKETVSFEFINVHPYSIPLSEEELSEEKLKAYYNANLANFKTNEQAVIYFARFPKNSTSRDEELIANELSEIRASVMAGNAVFAEEAQVESDDLGSARNGGQLGWFGKGQMVPEFETVAFSTPAGEISEPFRSNYGFHIISVDSVETDSAGEVSRVKASHILKNITAGVETLDSIEAVAEKLRDLADGKNLVDAGIELMVAIDSTPPFARGENPAGLGYLQNLGYFVFDNDAVAGDVGELFETENAFFVITIKEKIAKGTLPFEFAQSKIKQTLSDSLRVQQAKTLLTELREKIGEQSFEEFAAGDERLVAGTIENTTRKQFASGVGFNNEVLAVAFAGKEGEISKPVLAENGVYIVRTKSKTGVENISPDSPEFTSIRNQLKNEAARNAYQNWFEAQKKQLKVTENVRDFYF